MAYLPDFNFKRKNKRVSLDIEENVNEMSDPLKVIEDAFNKYILNNNGFMNTICLAIEYRLKGINRTKRFYISKNK